MGIFFVDFEPKRLPVVALRKILGNPIGNVHDLASPDQRVVMSTSSLGLASFSSALAAAANVVSVRWAFRPQTAWSP